MIRQVIDYIKDDSFEVRFDNSYIDIANYLQINYIDDEKQLIYFFKTSCQL